MQGITIEKRRPPTSINHGFSLTDSSAHLMEKQRADERTRTAFLHITSDKLGAVNGAPFS